jgi:Protein of unknown function (DUF2384)
LAKAAIAASREARLRINWVNGDPHCLVLVKMPYKLSRKKGKGAGIMVGTFKQPRRSAKFRGGVKRKRHKPVLRIKTSTKEARAISKSEVLQLLRASAGRVNVNRMTEFFGMSKAKLAETVGVRPDTLQRSSRASSPRTQTRLVEMLEIVSRVENWAGGAPQAMAWYRAEPLPEFGGRTAESLVKEGKATAVREYLDHVALGGFA